MKRAGVTLRGGASRAWAQALIVALVVGSLPVPARAAEPQVSLPAVLPSSVSAASGVVSMRPNRALPVVPTLPFSLPASPSDDELTTANVFVEPLVPVGGPGDTAENEALARAIRADATAVRMTDGVPFAAYQRFLDDHPSSAWRASLLVNLGIGWRRRGFITRALRADEEAWELLRDAREPRARALGLRALGELLELRSRLGHVAELEALLAQAERMPLTGPITERVEQARQALWRMKNIPEASFRCGPLAVGSLLTLRGADATTLRVIDDARSTERGTSLLQVQDVARRAGLDLHAIRRAPGSRIPVPSVVHWRVGHFAALVREQGGMVLVQDPTFVDELWVSRAAIEEEASGAFLVDVARRAPGWTPINNDAAGTIWGQGAPGGDDPQAQGPDDSDCCAGGGCQGLAVYGVQKMLGALTLSDIPITYTPAFGPAVSFWLRYNQRDVFQPQTFPYSNVGPKWTFDWFSFVEDDPGNPIQPVKVYRRGGGQETFAGYDAATQTYAPAMRTRAVLKRVSSTPVVYERRLTDGSVEVFARPVGTSVPRVILLTQVRDTNGHALDFVYDGLLRLVALRDATGLVTTLGYEDARDPRKITRVTDPYGRSARLAYDDNGRLVSITDVLLLKSEFTYDTADFINTLTTPYGKSRFRWGGDGNVRWLELTDPLRAVERIETWGKHDDYPHSDPTAPAGYENDFLWAALTLHWSKRAMAEAPGDLASAEVTHWLWSTLRRGIRRAHKRPLESRVWYAYPGQPPGSHSDRSTRSEPIETARVLDDGSVQTWRREYNQAGLRTKEIDPVGRETVYVYGTGSTPDPDPATGRGLDLLLVKQRSSATTFDLLSSFTYNANHQPLTVTDAASQSTMTTYDSRGRIATTVTPPRTGPGGAPLSLAERTTTYEYFGDAELGAGRLKKVTGPLTPAGTPVTQYAYDGRGRLISVTDPDGYTLTHAYDMADRPTRTTYPDGTYEETEYQRLDAESRRDRLSRWSHTLHDALRRVVATRDPLGRVTTQQWCACGSLDKLIDAKGNITSWGYDLQGRVRAEVRPDGQRTRFEYEVTTSRLKTRTDAQNRVATYTYFPDDRLQQVSYSNTPISTPAVSFTYDPRYSRVATMTDGLGTTIYGYHPVTVPPALGAGQLASVDAPLANDTVMYAYDELGRTKTRGLAATTHNSTWAFDALGRVATQTTGVGTFTFGYDGVTTRPASIGYPNGQTTTYGYLGHTGDHRLQTLTHHAPGGASQLSAFSYAYDVVGNITTWAQQVGGPQKTYAFTYDRADQLVSATLTDSARPPATLKRYAWAYDPAGNRTTEQVDDVPLGATYNARNQLMSRQPGGALLFRGSVNEPATITVQSKPANVPGPAAPVQFEGAAQVVPGMNTVTVTAKDAAGNVATKNYQVNVSGATTAYTYDTTGNLTSDGVKTYDWDAENRLVAVKQGAQTLAAFTYDGLGRRATKAAGGVTWSFVYDGDDVIEERGSNGVVLRYVHGPGVDYHLAQYAPGGAPVYLLADHLGSIWQQTNAAGAVTFTREYDPWGNLLAGANVGRYAFTGREWDPETGLHYYRARYYSAALGRFVAEDPIRADGGDSYYLYGRNSPGGHIDPTGETAVALGGMALFGLILVTAVAIHWTRYPPPLPPFPIPDEEPPPPPTSTSSGSGGGGGGSAMTGQRTTPQQIPIPFPDPWAVRNPTCEGIRQACLKGEFLGGDMAGGLCDSCAAQCQREGRWPIDRCPLNPKPPRCRER